MEKKNEEQKQEESLGEEVSDISKEAEELLSEANWKIDKIVERQQRSTALKRFPLVFSLLGAFGLVSIFYGFEKLIDRIPFLQENPWLLLATGIIVLVFTGTLYKQLRV